MIAISQISETLEQVAQAIVSVIDVDVLIVDRQLVRLVGTGRLARNLQTPVDQGSVFAYALKRGESFVIEDPRTHEACRNCGQKESVPSRRSCAVPSASTGKSPVSSASSPSTARAVPGFWTARTAIWISYGRWRI